MRKQGGGGGKGARGGGGGYFFPPPFLSPDRARLSFAFSQRPYHLRAWHRLQLVKQQRGSWDANHDKKGTIPNVA